MPIPDSTSRALAARNAIVRRDGECLISLETIHAALEAAERRPLTREIRQIVNGEPVTHFEGQLLTDGWYVYPDYDGPFADQSTAEYVTLLLDVSESLLGKEETGNRLQALIDLRCNIQRRMEDLIVPA